MRKILLIATIAAATLSLIGCQGKKQKNTDADKAVPVKVEAARSEQVSKIVDFTANLQAYKHNFITPAVNGVRIDKINVEVGDKVRKGQVLVELDKTQYNTTAVQLSNAETNLGRMKPVYESGGISKQQYDELETNVKVLRETIKNLGENLTFRSPIDGTITGRYNEVGDLYTMSSPNADGGVGILQVMQMDKLKAYVYVSEQYFPLVKMGMPVTVTTELYPDKPFEGKVTRISPAINAQTRTFEVEITVPNGSLTLRPGMYARTTFNMGEADGVTVEDVSVQRQLGTNDKFVYVINNGVAEKRIVTTSRQNGSRIEITSGLTAGENVAKAGMNKLVTGSKVEIVKE